MTDLTEQWLNIYKSKKCGSYWSGAFCYKTKEEAVKDLADKEHYLTTVNIEDVLNLQTQNTKLKEQLEIAVKRIEFLKKKTGAPYYGNTTYLKTIYQMCDKTLRQIQELEK